MNDKIWWVPKNPTNLELADAAGHEAFTAAVAAGLGYETALTEGLAAYCSEYDSCEESDRRREATTRFYNEE